MHKGICSCWAGHRTSRGDDAVYLSAVLKSPGLLWAWNLQFLLSLVTAQRHSRAHTNTHTCTHTPFSSKLHPSLSQYVSVDNSRPLLLSPHTCIVITSREPPMSIPHFSFLLRYIFASPSLNVSHSYNLDHKTASCSKHTTPLAHQRGAGWRQQALFFTKCRW